MHLILATGTHNREVHELRPGVHHELRLVRDLQRRRLARLDCAQHAQDVCHARLQSHRHKLERLLRAHRRQKLDRLLDSGVALRIWQDAHDHRRHPSLRSRPTQRRHHPELHAEHAIAVLQLVPMLHDDGHELGGRCRLLLRHQRSQPRAPVAGLKTYFKQKYFQRTE